MAQGLYVPRAARILATETHSLRSSPSLHRNTLVRNEKKSGIGESEILKSEKLHRKGPAGYNGNSTNTNFSNNGNTNMPVPTIEFRLTPEEEAMNEHGTGASVAANGTEGATTLINQGETIALPGFLKMDYTNDVRVCDKIAEGGGGVVYSAELLNSEMIQKHGRERVIVKTLKRNYSDSVILQHILTLLRTGFILQRRIFSPFPSRSNCDVVRGLSV